MKRRNPEACQPSCWDFASAISLQGLVWVHVHSRGTFSESWLQGESWQYHGPHVKTCLHIVNAWDTEPYKGPARAEAGRYGRCKHQALDSFRRRSRDILCSCERCKQQVCQDLWRTTTHLSVYQSAFIAPVPGVASFETVTWTSFVAIHHPFAGCCMMLRDASIVTIFNSWQATWAFCSMSAFFISQPASASEEPSRFGINEACWSQTE